MNEDLHASYLREVQHRLQLVLIRLRAGGATAEARFYAGRCRQAYWRGVRPGPGWRMPAITRRNVP